MRELLFQRSTVLLHVRPTLCVCFVHGKALREVVVGDEGFTTVNCFTHLPRLRPEPIVTSDVVEVGGEYLFVFKLADERLLYHEMFADVALVGQYFPSIESDEFVPFLREHERVLDGVGCELHIVGSIDNPLTRGHLVPVRYLPGYDTRPIDGDYFHFAWFVVEGVDGIHASLETFRPHAHRGDDERELWLEPTLEEVVIRDSVVFHDDGATLMVVWVQDVGRYQLKPINVPPPFVVSVDHGLH